MRNVLFLLLVLLSACGSGREDLPPAGQVGEVGAVVRVVDGDTLDVVLADGQWRVRLLGIDAPEIGTCFAAEATLALNAMASSGVLLEFEPDGPSFDAYGRLLAWVYNSGGVLVNEDLVHQGYARAYTVFPVSRAAQLVAAEDQAFAAGVGLWGACP